MALVKIRDSKAAKLGKIVSVGFPTVLDAKRVDDLSAEEIEAYATLAESKVQGFKREFPALRGFSDAEIEEAITALLQNKDTKPDEVLRETRLGKFLSQGGAAGYANLAVNMARLLGM